MKRKSAWPAIPSGRGPRWPSWEKKIPPAITLTDPRIKAAIAMSAPVPGGGGKGKRAFAGIAVPVFHMTGTRDNSPIGETSAAERRIPYDQATTPGSCLLILNGADHMTFSGHAFGAYADADEHYQNTSSRARLRFGTPRYAGTRPAAAWLYKGGFAKLLASEGTFETR